MSKQEIDLLKEELNLLREEIKALSAQIKPMTDIYTSLTSLGKWTQYGVVVFAGFIGAVYSILNIIKYFKK